MGSYLNYHANTAINLFLAIRKELIPLCKTLKNANDTAMQSLDYVPVNELVWEIEFEQFGYNLRLTVKTTHEDLVVYLPFEPRIPPEDVIEYENIHGPDGGVS